MEERYYDVHFLVKDDCKEGYSVFVKATDENEAVQIITDNHLYEEPEDLSYIDYIDEVTEKEYLEAKGIHKIDDKTIEENSTGNSFENFMLNHDYENDFMPLTVKNAIKEAMDDMLMQNNSCEYIIKIGDQR